MSSKGPCLDPEKMLGYCDQFPGTDEGSHLCPKPLPKHKPPKPEPQLELFHKEACMKIGDPVWYVRLSGHRYEGVVIALGPKIVAGVLRTIWYEVGGNFRAVHNVPRHAADGDKKCWLPREEDD